MRKEESVSSIDELVTLVVNKVSGKKNPNMPYVGLEHIAPNEPFLIATTHSNTSISINSVFAKGDILFGKLRPNLRKSLQALFDGYCSTDILVLRARPGILPEFAARVFQSESVFRDAIRTAEGTKMPRTSWSKLKPLPVFVPISPEQHFIIGTLDVLDTQIQQTEQLIAKLKQIKTGLLHDLLTRGIDEHGEMRDPVAHPESFQKTFYGKQRIPAEWNLYPLERVAKISSGVTLGRKLLGSDTVELPYLRVANVQDGYLDLNEMKTIRVPKYEVERFLLEPGDVLMTEGGDFDKLGRGTIWTGEIPRCLHQNHIFKVRPDRRYLYSEFLALISRSFYGKHFFLLSSKQSTNLASINSTQLKAFPIPCPTKDEQERIISILTVHNTRIATEASHLTKLKQLKKGLMDDLLSGRVRVTKLVADGEVLSV